MPRFISKRGNLPLLSPTPARGASPRQSCATRACRPLEKKSNNKRSSNALAIGVDKHVLFVPNWSNPGWCGFAARCGFMTIRSRCKNAPRKIVFCVPTGRRVTRPFCLFQTIDIVTDVVALRKFSTTRRSTFHQYESRKRLGSSRFSVGVRTSLSPNFGKIMDFLGDVFRMRACVRACFVCVTCELCQA